MSLKIAHIADIHIRGLTRHSEYRTVFEAFIADAKKQNVDVIFVGGDIFHTKTIGITPEYIDFMRWWLTALAEVAPVHLTLGNHDGNLVNFSRQDAISPIVETLKNPNVFLYKKSGVYEFRPGYNWCVFSLFDEQGWDSVKPEENKYNIACFHGSVRGAKTEGDWELSDGLVVDFFKGFDLCLLGDIHKMQYLGWKSFEKNGQKINKPWIAYPGSTVQQNFAEDLVHGWLLWTIEDDGTHEVEFLTLPNPNPFVTVEWQGSVVKTIKEASQFPKCSRFRVRSNINITQKDISLLTTQLKDVLGAIEVTFKLDESIDRDVITAGSLSIARDDLRNPEVLLEMMREYYESEDISESDWETIEELVKNYMKSVSVGDEIVRNTSWSVKKLEFENTFSYGLGNVIDFEKLNGITGILGQNRTGKSSIIGTLMYTLFNASDRGSLKNLFVINTRKDYCLARAFVSINGVDHMFERQTVKAENKKGPHGVTSLNAYVYKDGEQKELNGDARTDTDKMIRKLIGNVDDFMLTSMATQDDLKRFIKENATPRKAIISRFLDLDIFDKMFDVAKNDVSTIKAGLKNLTVQDWDKLVSQRNEENKEIDKTLVKLTRDLESIRVLLGKKQTELSEVKKLSPVSLEEVTLQRNKLASLSKREKAIQEKIETLVNEIADAKQKIEKIEVVKQSVNIDDLKRRQESVHALEQTLMKAKHRFDRESSTLQGQKKSVLKLVDVPCGDQFPTCKYIADSHHDKSLVDAQSVLVQKLKDDLDELEKNLETVKSENILDKIRKYEQIEKAFTSLQTGVAGKTSEHLTLEKNLTDLREQLSVETGKLEAQETALKNSQAHKTVELESEIRQYLTQARDLETQKLTLAQKKGRNETEIERFMSEQEKFTDFSDRLKIHELVANAFSKRGIPNRVLGNQLPVINHEISKILNGIVNFTVELETDSESNSLDVFINYGDSKRIIELGSGMEKMIASLVIRVALLNVSSLPKTDMLVIDEGFTDLDETGIEISNRLIRSLKKYFKNIIIITHIDAVKDVVDNIIEISRIEHDSKVVYE